MSLAKTLKKFAGHFTVTTGKERDIVHCDDSSPLYEVIREAHDGMLPIDWIFEKARSITIGLAGYDDDDIGVYDTLFEVADGCVDINTHDLFEWGKRFQYYVSQAKEEGLLSGDEDIDKQLMVGQFCQLRELAESILQAAQEADEEEDE